MPASLLETNVPPHVPHDLVRNWPFVFSHTYLGNPFDDLVPLVHREPPVFYATNAFPGESPAWIVRRMSDMSDMYKDTEHFSNMGAAPFASMIGESWYNVPAEMDPPRHDRYRTMIFPLFTPKAMRKLDDHVTEYARACLARFVDNGECEFMTEFAAEFPIRVICDLIGLPQEMTPQFLEWEAGLVHGNGVEEIAAATRSVTQYLRSQIEDRKRNPRDDLITFGVNAEVDGIRMSEDEVLGFAFNLFIGGLDTVSTNLGLQFWHLATHPDHQSFLRANPDKIPDAVDELMRAYPAVTTFRTCIKETMVAGVTMKPGDKVALSTTLAGRDPQAWDRPQEVILSRKPQHLGFATGPHLCLGLHLARRELIIAMTELLKALPPFRLAPGTEMEFYLGIIQPIKLPLVWS